MTPEERLWVIEGLERITTVSAAASGEKEMIQRLTSQLMDMRERLDALSVITAQIGVQTGVEPEHLVACPPKLANGAFMSPVHTGFDYERLLELTAIWDTTQERIPQYARYDEWFRAHGRGVSIIVPSYNDRRFLTRCLASLRRIREAYSSIRVIVSDDASPDQEHREFLDRIGHDGVIVLRNEENRGFARNVNSALQLIRDEDFVLLNSDTEAEGFWLEALQ